MVERDDGVLLLLCELVRDARRDVHQLLMMEEWRITMRTRHYLTIQCLDAPCASGWMTLYNYGYDMNFINATSLARMAFDLLLCRFSCFYDIPPPSSRCLPPRLRCLHQVLGLVLTFYVGPMEQGSLCIMFGVPPSTFSRTLNKAEEALSRALFGYAGMCTAINEAEGDGVNCVRGTLMLLEVSSCCSCDPSSDCMLSWAATCGWEGGVCCVSGTCGQVVIGRRCSCELDLSQRLSYTKSEVSSMCILLTSAQE